MGKSIRRIAFCFCGFIIYFSAFGQVNTYEDNGSIGISESYIYADTLNQFRIPEDFHSSEEIEFLPFLAHSSLKSNTHYWIKFRVFNTSDFRYWFLEMRPKLNIADLYIPLNDSLFAKMEGGLNTPYSNWVLPYTNHLFPVKENQEGDFYFLHIYSDYEIGLGLLSTTVKSFIRRSIPEYTRHGMFFGIIFVASLFSLIFFFTLKEKAYLFYALYVLSFAIFAFVDWGMIVKIISHTSIPWHKDLYTIPFSGMTIFLLLYAKDLLETQKYDRPIDYLIIASVFIRIAIYFTGTFFRIDELYNPSIDNILLLVIFVAALRSLRRGYQPARYLLAGLSFLYLGLIVHSLETRGLVPYNVLPLFSMYKTGVVEMIFFSFALADRFRIMKRDQNKAHHQTIEYLKENSDLQNKIIQQLNENEKLKDKVNRELEIKVKERTKELEEANDVILQINHYLEDSNRKLASDVRKISINRVMQKTATYEEFKEIYPNEESCYHYLDKLKWSNGFKCKKCGYEKFSVGNTPYSRRCSRCNYIERITSYTIFSGIKFPVNKAFYMLFLLNSGKNFTIEKLSEILDLRKQTVWYFKKKITSAMNGKKGKTTLEEGWSRWIFEGIKKDKNS